LGFLGLGPFSRENPGFEGWKGLDFLGFSRPNRAFSMGYAGFSLKEIFSRPFAPAPEPWERQPTILACVKGRIGHGASLIRFLLFCNKLLALIALAMNHRLVIGESGNTQTRTSWPGLTRSSTQRQRHLRAFQI
jgi:hypothetical protein